MTLVSRVYSLTNKRTVLDWEKVLLYHLYDQASRQDNKKIMTRDLETFVAIFFFTVNG